MTVTVGISVGITRITGAGLTKIRSVGITKVTQAGRVWRRPPRTGQRGQPVFTPGERRRPAVAAA